MTRIVRPPRQRSIIPAIRLVKCFVELSGLDTSITYGVSVLAKKTLAT
jgi:hypothetical protein